jgi:NAD(P)-dependent dehydrogenase (short-subunit alcohol dehydrogenase family)
MYFQLLQIGVGPASHTAIAWSRLKSLQRFRRCQNNKEENIMQTLRDDYLNAYRSQALLPGMRSARFGRIVNVTSLVTRGLPFRSSYAAAKSTLESLTRTMAIELAPDGITANAVAPGPTETEMFRENNPKGSEGEKRYLV